MYFKILPKSTVMDDFERELKTDFINEALLNLEEAESAFMDLEMSSDRKPLLELIFRLAHNLKGGSRAVGFADVAEFTHHLENLVLKIQKAEVPFSKALVTVLLRSNDRLVEMLASLKQDFDLKFSNQDLIQELEHAMTGALVDEGEAPIESEEAPVTAEVITDELAGHSISESMSENLTDVASELPIEVQPQSQDSEVVPEPSLMSGIPDMTAFFEAEEPAVAQAGPSEAMIPLPDIAPEPVVKEAAAAPLRIVETPAAPAKSGGDGKGSRSPNTDKNDEVVRVALSKIDQLNNYVGELIIWQSMVQQQALEFESDKLSRSLIHVLKISKEIQQFSMGLRLLPVKPLIQKLQRVVRDTSHTLGKEIDLQVEGDQLEIDKTVLDRLTDPLIHILRNAVDHGIEMPDERMKAGKRAQGRVQLAFRTEGNNLMVEIRDDGKGMDPERLRVKAIEKGVITASTVLSEKQLIHLIFHPGFSTKTETSEISGRGVGMDVVKTNIEKAGGQVEVDTRFGHGSIFLLRIPLSLAVIDGMMVFANKNRYIIPLSQVRETLNVGKANVFQEGRGLTASIDLRGQIVPLVTLAELMSPKKSIHSEEFIVRSDQSAVIVSVQDKLMGLVVDDIQRSQQVVIKPLASGIPAQAGWIGSCILGDGQPTLILSPIDLLRGRETMGVSDVPQRKAV